MPPKRQVYLLDPKQLEPETIAVTFAKTSRSPQRFCEIAAELSAEKSAEFHEKWVVGYGHASVAEHAVLHIAVENISRLAVEVLESCRLASFTEKSTRYQKWSSEDFYLPSDLEDSHLRDLYQDTLRGLFTSYQEALPAVKAVIEQDFPQQPDESAAAWERRIRSRYVDICRYYLPAAALANVGVTINARALEHTLTKMLSHPLAEVRALGEELKAVGQGCVPTLVKYANPNAYIQNSRQALRNIQPSLAVDACIRPPFCQLVDYDADIENVLLAAGLFSQSQAPFEQLLSHVRRADTETKKQWAAAILAGLNSYDIPLRELEYGSFTFDVMLDQGGYFELKRHRMMTQTPQALTTNFGYAVPRGIQRAGFESHFNTAMRRADAAYQALAAWDVDLASYVVPNAYNRRVLLKLNLRSAMHLIALRSAPNAHFSVRRLAQAMAEQIRTALPLFGAYLRANPSETVHSIENEYFSQV